MEDNLIALITAHISKFSKGQKKIAQYIVEHYDEAAFMTALRLGQTVGTSESTVVRFAAQVPQAERTTQTQPVDQPLTLTAGGQAESAPAHARVFYPARLMALALLALLLAEWGMYHREKY